MALRTARVHNVRGDILRGHLWRYSHFWNDMLDLCARNNDVSERGARPEGELQGRNALMTRTYARDKGLLDERGDYGALPDTLC